MKNPSLITPSTGEIRRLIELARNGDKEALVAAVELAERLLLEQELVNAPAGVRTTALQGMDALHKRRRDQARRSDAARKSNKKRGEKIRDGTDKVLESFSLHDKPQHTLTGKVLKHFKRYKVKELRKIGLSKPPCDKTVRKGIKKKLEN